MLENLRDKIHNVQQDISESLRNLTVGENSIYKYKLGIGQEKFTLNAGADFLKYYQKKWEDLHKISEDNVKKAEEVDGLISGLHQHCQSELAVMQHLNQQVNQIPKLHSSVLQLMNRIGELEGLFEEVEFALVNLEDIIETQNLQEKQLDERFQLALYKEKRLAHFENLKARLEEEHVLKLHKFEEKQQVLLKERQEAFAEVFQKEMEMYKTHGKIERISSTGSSGGGKSLHLEEIDLEDDAEGQEALDAFLGDTVANTSSPGITTDEGETTAEDSTQEGESTQVKDKE